VLVPALVLTGLGLICVFSFGGAQVLRQAVWAACGVAACVFVSRIPLEKLRRAAVPALVAVCLCLLAALLFAPSVEGTHRWIVVGSIGYFQPSELAKLAVVLFLASRLERQRRLDDGLLKVAWPVLVTCALVVLAPDLGTAVFLAAVATAMLMIAGARLGKVMACALAAVPVILFVASRYPYMQRRLEFFTGKLNYQQDQALLALGSGGLIGNGLGAGRQKMDYLPAGHTDFVLPNLGEELGFLGVALVGALFALILIHGLRVALAALRRKERFGFHVAVGATFVVVFQAAMNIAVATAAAPTKGISLPFLSQGGSNLLMALVAIGLVVNVGRSLEKAT
jgi:cell division protein FtsW